MHLKVTKRFQKCGKGSQKGSKGSQKRTKREPREHQMEPKEGQMGAEAKHCRDKESGLTTKCQKIAKKVLPQPSFWEIFALQIEAKVDPEETCNFLEIYPRMVPTSVWQLMILHLFRESVF